VLQTTLKADRHRNIGFLVAGLKKFGPKARDSAEGLRNRKRTPAGAPAGEVVFYRVDSYLISICSRSSASSGGGHFYEEQPHRINGGRAGRMGQRLGFFCPGPRTPAVAGREGGRSCRDQGPARRPRMPANSRGIGPHRGAGSRATSRLTTDVDAPSTSRHRPGPRMLFKGHVRRPGRNSRWLVATTRETRPPRRPRIEGGGPTTRILFGPEHAPGGEPAVQAWSEAGRRRCEGEKSSAEGS